MSSSGGPSGNPSAVAPAATPTPQTPRGSAPAGNGSGRLGGVLPARFPKATPRSLLPGARYGLTHAAPGARGMGDRARRCGLPSASRCLRGTALWVERQLPGDRDECQQVLESGEVTLVSGEQRQLFGNGDGCDHQVGDSAPGAYARRRSLRRRLGRRSVLSRHRRGWGSNSFSARWSTSSRRARSACSS